MTHDSASTQQVSVCQPAEQVLAFLHELLRPLPGQDEESAAPRRRARPRELQSDHLWFAMLVAILRGFTGFASVWRLITWTGVGSFPLLDLTRAAVRKRLLHTDLSGLHDLLSRVSAALLLWTRQAVDESLAPFAHTILALDQSTLDAVRRTCQDVRQEEQDSPRLLVGKLAGLFDVRRQQWVRLLFREDVFANEKQFVEDLFGGIQPGSLILADLGYFSFPWFDWLTDQGCFWLSRLREKTSYRIEHVFVRQGSTLDALIWLGAHRADGAKHLVRLIQFEQGGLSYRYITNVCDPQLLSMSEAARLYARRWDIELAFKALKGELGLHLWWSSHPILVLEQLFCALILAQVLHALHLQVAAQAGVDLFDVSLPVLVKLLASAPARSTSESLIALLLRKGREQGLLRPSRRYLPVVPALLQSYTPAPADLLSIRKEHYAQRKCQPRSQRACFQPRFCSFFVI
ncbi:MAG TPA: IS4 family transposase [Ktedonobacteraceae bacterium]|nr:IS4 family transposase [Ktedonobacteraceae bacterium]